MKQPNSVSFPGEERAASRRVNHIRFSYIIGNFPGMVYNYKGTGVENVSQPIPYDIHFSGIVFIGVMGTA